ncbi:hypothetical protein [Saccharicrinis aurantiacus]|uniref:hypothetical protein n=1 Tax=Saccharicrinis aurantiacus TaxID=1849719 RepID=UPI000838857F|nr:hypothetical protein [Saccharicrinis aurantiacus]
MDILKTATDWAKAEVFSTAFFIVFGFAFVLASIGFWQLGKTDMAKAYIIPTLVAGAMLLTIGFGLFFTNISRISSFAADYNTDASAFVEAEIVRVDKAINEYKTIVFKAIPIIIAVCALLIIFMNSPVWRASMITTIAMLVVILLIDGTARDRIEVYKAELISLEMPLNK